MTKKNMEVVMDKDLKCWIELHNTFPLNKILKKEIIQNPGLYLKQF